MKQPDLFGDLAAKSLYNFEYESDACKVANPDHTINIFGRPSLIPGVEYPISEGEERLLDAAWNHAVELSQRGVL